MSETGAVRAIRVELHGKVSKACAGGAADAVAEIFADDGGQKRRSTAGRMGRARGLRPVPTRL